jgi:hypothetical protein
MQEPRAIVTGNNRASTSPIDINILSNIISKALLIVFIGD